MMRLARSIACVVVLALTARAQDDGPGPNRPDEPIAPRASIEQAARFLDAVAVNWTEQRQCGTCHTNYAALIARGFVPGSSPEIEAVRGFFENRVAGWDKPEKDARPRWDTEVVATAATLAIHDARTTGTLHPRTREALDRMWRLQRDDGAWEWLKCDWPPYESDDYYGAVFAALGVGYAPDRYQDEPQARRGLEKLRDYFKATPAPSLHHRAFLLWASLRIDGLMTAAEREAVVKDLLALQREDGGWNLPSLGDWHRRDQSPNDKNAPSDGYATGLVVFLLRETGRPVEGPAVQRGVAWLRSNQRESGRWFTRSVNNDKAHYITHAGTAFALMALRACEPPSPAARLDLPSGPDAQREAR